jgi:hypothetical protein
VDGTGIDELAAAWSRFRTRALAERAAQLSAGRPQDIARPSLGQAPEPSPPAHVARWVAAFIACGRRTSAIPVPAAPAATQPGMPLHVGIGWTGRPAGRARYRPGRGAPVNAT